MSGSKLSTAEELYTEWWEFIRKDDMTDLQVEEMKRAFMSGLAAFLTRTVDQISVLPDAESDAHLQAMSDELQHYMRTLKVFQAMNDTHEKDSVAAKKVAPLKDVVLIASDEELGAVMLKLPDTPTSYGFVPNDADRLAANIKRHAMRIRKKAKRSKNTAH